MSKQSSDAPTVQAKPAELAEPQLDKATGGGIIMEQKTVKPSGLGTPADKALNFTAGAAGAAPASGTDRQIIIVC